jgi:hypothetical protein
VRCRDSYAAQVRVRPTYPVIRKLVPNLIPQLIPDLIPKPVIPSAARDLLFGSPSHNTQTTIYRLNAKKVCSSFTDSSPNNPASNGI